MINKYDVDENDTKFSFNNIKDSLKYLKPYRGKMLGVFIASLIITFIAVGMVKVLQYVIDDILINKDLERLAILGIVSVLIYFIQYCLDKIKRKLLNIINQGIISSIKEDLFSHIQYLSSNFYNTRPHGKILVRLTDYAEDISNFITYRLINTILDLISLIIVLVFMFTTNISLSLIIIGGVSILIIVYSIITPIKRKRMMIVNNKRSNLNAYQLESIKGVLTTQSFNREEKNTRIVEKLNNEFNRALKSVFWIGNLSWLVTDIIAQVINGLILIVGINFFYPTISIGIIVAMISYSERFYGPIRRLFKTLNQSTDTITYLERVIELLNEEIEIKNNVNSKEINISGDIEFKDVSFSYIESHKVLDNVSFKVNKNERIAIVGETGSGKTTITNLLARFYEKDSGQILIDGVDINDIDINCLRKNVTVMLQDNFLFTMSIIDNLCVGNKNIKRTNVATICKKMNIHNWILSFENGYDTILKNGAEELSEGQRQLLCYARTVIANPKILILDEATSKIDTKTERMIKDSLDLLFKDRTVIIIAHRLSTIMDCDKIIVMKDKKVFESGNHKELMRLKGEYYNLYTSAL